jgi:glucose-1-phosphate cytidylyltransferase
MPRVKVVILAGGQGTRLAEETELRPKPMVDIGGRPILWHIMKHYAHHGFTEFNVALGYRGEHIKRFFLDQVTLSGDLTIHLAERRIDRRHIEEDDWVVELVDTGLETNTGGRVRRVADRLDGQFMLTYGDGVSDVDLRAVLDEHNASDRLATVTAVRPGSRFGGLSFEDGAAVRFIEKPQIGEGWVSGGFMVLQPEVLSYIEGDSSSFELDVLEPISQEGRLGAYRHEGFWQSMDNIRDVRYLRALWTANEAPWRTWE